MKPKNKSTTPAPEPQPKNEISFDDCYPAPPWVYHKNYVKNMSREDSLKILYKIRDEAKQQIARGEYCTHKELGRMIKKWQKEELIEERLRRA